MSNNENILMGSHISFSTNTVVEYVDEEERWMGYVSLFVRVTKQDRALLVENYESERMYSDNILELFAALPQELPKLVEQSQLLNNLGQEEDRLMTSTLVELAGKQIEN